MRFFLALLAVMWSFPVAAVEWREAETAHFRIVSSGDERSLIRFSERLEAFHTLLKLATGTNDANREVVKVRVFLVPSVDDVKRFYGQPNSDVAGYYSPRAGGAIAVVPRATGDGDFSGQLVLFHEYAHHFMLQYTPAAYPSWYVEGFAEIASTASFERKDAITFGKAASHRQYELEGASRYSAASMLNGTYLKDGERGRAWSYGDAWLVTHYLTFSDSRRGQLRTYLNALNAGKKPSEAAQVFGDLPALQREITGYLNSRSFPYRAVPLPSAAAPPALRTLSPAEAALIDYEIDMQRLTSLPSKDDAEPVDGKNARAKTDKPDFEMRLAEATRRRNEWLSRLEATVGRYGGEAAGWRLLADARCESELFAGCTAAADRALAIAPGDGRAMARKAEAMIAQAGDLADDKRQAQIGEARALALGARAANPDDPLPLLVYYRSFGAGGQMASQDALDALLRAVRLVPQMSGPRLTLAGEFIARGRLGDARKILQPLAFSPHESGGTAQARAMLEAIEAQLEANKALAAAPEAQSE